VELSETLEEDAQVEEAKAKAGKKTWSELDKFIELLLDSKQTD
jgi:hypothetical protein